MPRPISDEELQLKKRARRRLVGAIVLVTAVAVILPMVLDSEPRPVSQNVDIQIPSPDSAELKPKSAADAKGPAVAAAPTKAAPPPQAGAGAPVKAAPGPQAGTGAPVKAAPGPQAGTGAPIKGMPPVVAVAPKDAAATPASAEAATAADEKAKDDTRTAAKDAPKAPAKDAAAAGAYVVQVAALADSARVKQLQKQMSAAGIKVYTEAVTTKSGEVTRVRAGPYATKEAAESARTQLKKAGLDGKVVPK